MLEKSLLFVVCTKHDVSNFKKLSETYKFFNDNNLIVNKDYVVCYNNTTGLSKKYNTFLTPENKDKIIIFIHDDVILGYNINCIRRELNQAHRTYDIVGLAGATKINLSQPILWHIMATGRSGAVGHSNTNLSQMSNYGPTPARCIVVDGVFISVNVESVLNKNHKFDEQFDFHCYDLDFCIEADKKGLSIGTWPLWVTHLSAGLKSINDPVFIENQNKFIKKWGI